MKPHIFTDEELESRESLAHWTVSSSARLTKFDWIIPNFDSTKNNKFRSPEFQLLKTTVWLELSGPNDDNLKKRKELILTVNSENSVKFENIISIGYLRNPSAIFFSKSPVILQLDWENSYIRETGLLEISYTCLQENCKPAASVNALKCLDRPELVWSSASYTNENIEVLSLTYKWSISLAEIKSSAGATSSISSPVFFPVTCESDTWQLIARINDNGHLEVSISKPCNLKTIRCFWSTMYNTGAKKAEIKIQDELDEYYDFDDSEVLHFPNSNIKNIPNDVLIMCHIIGIPETKDPEYLPQQLEQKPDAKKFYDFKKLLFKTDFSDFSIVSKESILPTHKNILSVISPAFEEMFKTHPKMNQLEINDLSQNSIIAMLTFVYTEEIDKQSLSIKDFLDLFTLAFKYQIINLQRVVKDILITELKVVNVVDILITTDNYGDLIWKENIIKFIKDNLKMIHKTDYKKLCSFMPEVGAELILWK